MEIVQLILGFGLFLCFFYDFFFTTLSVGGAGFISKKISFLADRVLQRVVGQWGRRFYIYHGLVVNLSILLMWGILVWAALYFIFSSNPEAIITSEGRVANNWERLYFTGYTLSTLGLGNIKPTSPFFEILTSCFSFLGFIFFTSSMTYFLSVSTAVVNKGTLARSIFNLGNSPEKIAERLHSLHSSYTYQQTLVLQEMIDRHTVNHQAYPVVHFYSRSKPEDCLSLNLARLDEAVSILLYSKETGSIKKELLPLRSALDHFLNNISEKYAGSLPKIKDAVNPATLPYHIHGPDKEAFEKRRRTLERLVRSEGFQWKDVV